MKSALLVLRSLVCVAVPLSVLFVAATVTAYWARLGDRKDAERRVLEFDLVFPTLFAAALLAGLWMSATAAGRKSPPVWAIGLIVVGLVMDWTENLAQLRLLDSTIPLDGGVVNLASTATILKLWTATLVIVGIGAYAVIAVRRGIRRNRTGALSNPLTR
jgi:hypothetical protein